MKLRYKGKHRNKGGKMGTKVWLEDRAKKRFEERTSVWPDVKVSGLKKLISLQMNPNKLTYFL